MEKGQERSWQWDGRWHPKHLIGHQENLGGESSLCGMGSQPSPSSHGSFWEGGNCPVHALGCLRGFWVTCLYLNLGSVSTLACCQHSCPGTPGAGIRASAQARGKTPGFLQKCCSGKSFLKEKPWLLNVKGEKEVNIGGLGRKPTGTRWLLVAAGRSDSEGSLAILIPCPTVRKLGQNRPQFPILSVAQ